MGGLKDLVSKKKNRFKEDGFDLDLSYITPKLIAMGFPAENLEGMYRNRMKDVQAFFLNRHENHYKVYNLCSERSYSPLNFKNATASFPFDDHNPCEFALLVKFCEDAFDYLHADEENVIAVHCKAGKGRTGLVLACYLIFDKLCLTADDALTFYAERRTKNKKGVTIPSQIRWVYYYADYCHKFRWANPPREFNFAGVPVRLLSVMLSGKVIGDLIQPWIKISDHKKTVVWNSKVQAAAADQPLEKMKKGQTVFCIPIDCLAAGEIHVMFYDAQARDKKLFGFWLHSTFLADTTDAEPKVVLCKEEIDEMVGDKNHHRFSKDFTVTIYHSAAVEASTALAAEEAVEEDEDDDDDEASDKKKKKGKGVSGAKSLLRQLVSRKKLRFQKDGFDLDLSYITGNIIAMGFPSVSLEGMYRNKMSEVRKFFKTYHDGHYKVYNLCSERNYTPDHFDNSVATYPFDDHNPPSFKMLCSFCDDAAEFLDRSDKNIVAVHCKAGKGRTGTTISALLLLLGLFPDAEQALCFYGSKRTSNIKGVTIPSQQRYVHYYEEYLANYRALQKPFPFGGVRLTMVGIVLSPRINFNPGGGCDPWFRVSLMNRTVVYDSRKAFKGKSKEWKKSAEWELEFEIPVCGDLHVVFYNRDKLGGTTKMFGFWFNTNFLHDKGVLFRKEDLDTANKDKKCVHFPKEFVCEVLFTGLPEKDTSGALRRMTHLNTEGDRMQRRAFAGFAGGSPPADGAEGEQAMLSRGAIATIAEEEAVEPEDKEADGDDEPEYSELEAVSSEELSDDEFIMRSPGTDPKGESDAKILNELPKTDVVPTLRPTKSAFPAAVVKLKQAGADEAGTPEEQVREDHKKHEVQVGVNLASVKVMKDGTAVRRRMATIAAKEYTSNSDSDDAPPPPPPVEDEERGRGRSPARRGKSPSAPDRPWRCADCGHENISTNKFCGDCGKKPPPRYCVKHAKEKLTETCPICGAVPSKGGGATAAARQATTPSTPTGAEAAAKRAPKRMSQTYKKFEWVETLASWGVDPAKAKSYALKFKARDWDQFEISPDIITRDALKDCNITGADATLIAKGVHDYAAAKKGATAAGVIISAPTRPAASPSRR